ncbi:MAG TPA: nucleotidyltransferase domain-containing protein [Patescibacteria group bacterium]|nr:nucleotidyltransferase domain-containing protein [Patescibacteria group bacterium]
MEKVKIPNQNKVIEILQQNQIEFAAFFGSRAKGVATKNSDYDILVEFSPRASIGIFEVSGIIEKIEHEVGNKVELVTKKYLHPLLKEEILKTMRVLYDNRKR